MRTFSVSEIMALRDMYMEPPYPGFNLDEVLRKRAARGTKLTRGENAWSVASAKSTDEGVARIVRGALNKLAPEKYNEVIDDLTTPSLIESERAMQIVIDLIFKKALQEPGYSEMYARLCFDMAMYEFRLQTASSPAAGSGGGTPSSGEGQKRTSKFREQIIRVAQKEFQLTDPHQFARLEGEELEEARSSLIKRKKANITFVGQLYMHKVLSPGIMLSIVQTVLKTGDAGQETEMPQEVDIEVLNALLETVGKALDRDPNNRKALDNHFEKLRQLLRDMDYPMRTRFKIMNLIELREMGWEPRVTRADNQAPTTLQEQQAKEGASSGATLKSLGPRSPTVATPTSNTRRGGGGGGMHRFPSSSQFPDSPQPHAPPTLATWRNVAAPQRETPVAYTPAEINSRRAAAASGGKQVDLPFDKRVKALLTEWVNERSNEPIPNWRSRFKATDWDNDDDLSNAVVTEVIREACITTKKGAQHEACSFIRVGLAFEPDDAPVVLGLVEVLVKAIEDGIKEDVPKFYERFVSILHMVTEKETIVELYCDAAKLLYVAFEQVRSEDGALEELLAVWKLLPRPEDQDEVLPDAAVNCVVNLRDTQQGEIAGELVVSLVEGKLVAASAIESWLGSTSAAQAPDVVEVVRARLKL